MTAVPTLEKPVVQYLHLLEHAIKQKVGVVPEDVLVDAREHLVRDLNALRESEPGISDDELVEHFIESFGVPEAVAQDYEDSAKPILLKISGHAPNWRICCCRCGRSAPAAKAGITRIGARSYHKYIVGWCHDCRSLRVMRLLRDLHLTNLSDTLGATMTSQQLREKMHYSRTVATLLIAMALFGTLALMAVFVTSAAAQQTSPDPVLQDLPSGWSITKAYAVEGPALKSISQRLGVPLQSLSNNVISDGEHSLQVNILRGADPQQARRIYETLADGKKNRRTVCLNDRVVTEMVVRTPESARFAAKARYLLPVLPAETRYHVEFSATSVTGLDAMQWNPLFNLCLQWQSAEPKKRPAIESEIGRRTERATFLESLVLKNAGLGPVVTEWNFQPAAADSRPFGTGNATEYRFEKLPSGPGMPMVHVHGVVTSRTGATTPVTGAQQQKLCEPTKYWPSDDAQIAELAAQITQPGQSDAEKLKRLLAWFGNSENIRYAGQTGSRYGTLQVLKQKHGHCWDYADLFITLSRATGLPAREVFGWLDGGQGHVWVEVAVGGSWRQIDPTSGWQCGSDYVPLCLSEDGEMSLLYTSMVRLQPVDSHVDEPNRN